MRGFAAVVPLFIPVLVLSMLVAALVARPLARRLQTSPIVAATLIAGLGLIVAATLTPLADALEEGVRSTGACDTSRLWFASIESYLRPTSVSLNVLLFMPFGVAAGWLPRTRAADLIVLFGLLLPILVEGTQMLLPALGRGCETGDIVDNTTGFILGLGIGWVVRMRTA